jgi:amidase
MVGSDRYDNLTFQAIGHYAEAGYAQEVVGKEALCGMKLGLPWDPYWSTNGVSLNLVGVSGSY